MKIRTLSVALTFGLAVGLAALLLLSGPVWAGEEVGEDRTEATLFDAPGPRPVLQSIDPVSNTHTAPLTASVSITYDQPMSLTHVTTATFAVHARETGLLSQTYGVLSGTIALTPTSAFKPGELVQVSATTGTLNFTGTEPATSMMWEFRAKTLGGSGRFELPIVVDPVEDSTMSVALGDLDGDGDLDLVVDNQQEENFVYLGNGDGTFYSPAHEWGDPDDTADAVILGDMDGDGDLDIVHTSSPTNRVYVNDGDGTFDTTVHEIGATNNPWDLALGDMDGDGDLDVVVVNRSHPDTVHFNNGDGTFDPTAWAFGGDSNSASVVVGDVDGDGALDVLIGNSYNVRVWLNPGDGRFNVRRSLEPNGEDVRDLDLGDLDGDGDLDLVMGRATASDYVVFNDGHGFSDTVPYELDYSENEGLSVAIGDLDGDEDLDIFIGIRYEPNKVYLNNGDGTFATRDQGPGRDKPNSLALGDLDGDGDLDAVMGNDEEENVVWLNRSQADLSIEKSVTPQVARPGEIITYTLAFSNVGVLTATGVLITDIVPTSIGGWSIAGNSGAAITPTGGYTFAWTVQDLEPGQRGVITLTGQAPPSGCARVVNTATITTADADEWLIDNRDVVTSSLDVPLFVEDIDAGASLAVNGAAAPPGTKVCLAPGQTVTLTTSFGGEEYEDVVEAHYPLDVAVHAQSYVASPGTVYLDADLGYTPFDIFVITSTDTTTFTFEMNDQPEGEVVKIIGLHAMVPRAVIGELGNPIQDNNQPQLVLAVYGTVESDGHLELQTSWDNGDGNIYNRLVANDVVFSGDDEGDGVIMVQELAAGTVDLDRDENGGSKPTWWRMALVGRLASQAYSRNGLNDELPYDAWLEEDGMLWFKARNPAKWGLVPLMDIDGQAYDKAWDLGKRRDCVARFWEMDLGSAFNWYAVEGREDSDQYQGDRDNGDGGEQGQFLGPVMEMDSFSWDANYGAYLKFFFAGPDDEEDDDDDDDLSDLDNGSGGADFWTSLLTSTYGYSEDGDGNIYSPIFAWRLREGMGTLEPDDGGIRLVLADDQDLLILSDSDGLEFRGDGDRIAHRQGTDAHWVVEDGLIYSGSVPTDDAFNITLHDFHIDDTGAGTSLVVAASNDYGPGDDASSTMYLAYRKVGAYAEQFSKVPMIWSAVSGQWSVELALDEGVYDVYVVAIENDDVYGKVAERQGVSISDSAPLPPALISPADGSVTTTNEVPLTWKASTDPDVAGYWVKINGIEYDAGDATGYDAGPLADGLYDWSVAAYYEDANITGPHTDSWQFEVNTTQSYGVALAPNGMDNVVPGEVVAYSHILTNTGDGPDTFGLALSSSQGWAFMDTTPLSLGAGATATLLVSVTVPADTLSGTVDTTVITATSQGDTAAWVVVRDTTTVVDRAWRVYLPTVMKGE